MPGIAKLLRKKPISSVSDSDHHLKRCLTAWDLTFLGIGAIIGAGIFILTGIVAATKAGPAIIMSFVLAGFACGFAALSYAELAASVGGCGSAYSYAYVILGELPAWIIGWDLILEYALSVSTVAVGWSRYFVSILHSMGISLPHALIASPHENGIINLPAMLIVLAITTALAIGVKFSARFNIAIVLIKLFVIALFIAVACFHIQPIYWHPFLPFGWSGVVSGAALIFFAYIGFDAVAAAAEEVIQPQKNLPIGILASLAVCTAIYIIVAALLTAIAPYTTLNVASPMSHVLINLGYTWLASIVAVGAIAGLTTVMLVMQYGLTRVFFAISRDGLLPIFFKTIHPKTYTPVRIIIASGIIMSLIAAFVPIKTLTELVNIGTLSAFMIVCVGVLFLRYKRPDIDRPFKLPFSTIIPFLGVAACFYLMLNLTAATWMRFLIWLMLGLILYLFYGARHSKLNR